MKNVIHIPGRTPYARKLNCDQFNIINGKQVGNIAVPRDASLSWLLQQVIWDCFDVVHLHHIEFESLEILDEALDKCEKLGKIVVFTAHDLAPIFIDLESYRKKQAVVAKYGVPFICLTPRAAKDTGDVLDCNTQFLPHGYVVSPECQIKRDSRRPGPTRFLIYGSLRRNRDVALVLHCWRFARNLKDTILHLVLRAPSTASLMEEASAWQSIHQNAVDPRLQISVLSYPSDDEINLAMGDADCLLLPYRWSNHSGQIEHAFDLGVLPVSSRTGYLPDQVALHGSLVDQPVWFDWSPTAPYQHGAELVDAMERAHQKIQCDWIASNQDDFLKYRKREHRLIIDGYCSLYI